MALVKITDLPALVGAVDTANDNLVLRDASTSSTVKTTPAAVVAAEATARAAADTTLQTNITAEATARATADATLTTNLNTEITNRTNADNLRLLLAGGTMTGAIVLPAVDPTLDNHASRKVYVDTADNLRARILIDYDPTATGAFPTGATIADGARYRVSVVGTITTTVGPLTVYAVKVGDILEALVNNPSNAAADWSIQSVLMQPSSETVVGPLEIATNAEMLAGTDNARALTPLRLEEFVDNIHFRYVNVNVTPYAIVNPGSYGVSTLAITSVINLPVINTTTDKWRIHIFDIDGNSRVNSITINAAAGQTIAGQSSLVIHSPYGGIMLMPGTGGTQWHVLGAYGADYNFVSVYPSAAATAIANNVSTLILFNTVEFAWSNVMAQFNLVTNQFTPVYNGHYLVDLQVQLQWVANTDIALWVAQGGIDRTRQVYRSLNADPTLNNIGTTSYHLSTVVYLTAGAATDFRIIQVSGGPLNLVGGSATTSFLRIKMLNW